MEIIISNADGQPIYEQICRQIRGAILSGTLAEGDALPSMRALAKDLRVSVITTRRAYDELEREGFVNSVAGKGCYVAKKNVQFIREDQLRQIEARMREIARLAASCGLARDELLNIFAEILKGE